MTSEEDPLCIVVFIDREASAPLIGRAQQWMCVCVGVSLCFQAATFAGFSYVVALVVGAFSGAVVSSLVGCCVACLIS